MFNLEKLRKIRESKGLSQNELARRCNIAGSHYHNVERGLKGVSMETLSLICDQLEISVQDILDPSDKLPPILPLRDKNSIIVEKTTNTVTNTVRFTLPPSPESFQFVLSHINQENLDWDKDFKKVLENWHKISPDTKAEIIRLLQEKQDD